MRLEIWIPAVIAGLLLGGCGDSRDDFTDEMPEDFPEGAQTDGGTGSVTSTTITTAAATSDVGTTGGPAPECQSSDDCLGNEVCVASWDPETQTAGEADCAFACIPSYDESLWCADAGACCDPEAICTARGYCVPPQEPGAADSSSGGEDSSSTGDGSGSTGDGSMGGDSSGTGGTR